MNETLGVDADSRFPAHYLEHVADEDLAELGKDYFAGIAASHWQLGRTYSDESRADVRVFTPSEETDGYSTGRTSVEVVTKDMPFLVDSVSAEITRQRLGIHLIVHPTLLVLRDASGRITEILDQPEASGQQTASGDTAAMTVLPDASDAEVESWIHLSVDKITDAARLTEVEDGIRRVLVDVAHAVRDWPEMRQRATAIADELTDAPPAPELGTEAGIAARLLRWLDDGNFTFLGYREYSLESRDGEDVLVARPETGLGILSQDDGTVAGSLGRAAASQAREKRVLVLTKANSRSTVHRRSYLDYIGVKTFDSSGQVTGERRFLGLFTATAFTQSVKTIPVIGEKIKAVLERSGFPDDSHSGKDLLTILETYPRDELFQADTDDLYDTALTTLHLQERRRPRVFLRRDRYARFMSAMVYMPRDQYNTAARLNIEAILREEFGAESVDYEARLTESVLARLHFVVRVARDKELPEVEQQALEKRIIDALRDWRDDFAAELDDVAYAGVEQWRDAFGESYKEDFAPADAVDDVARLIAAETGTDVQMKLYRSADEADPNRRRLKFYRTEPMSLSDVLPYLTHLGADVTDERPYHLHRADGARAFIYDFGLHFDDRQIKASTDYFTEAFAAAWNGRSESDSFEELVLAGNIPWRDVVIVRAYARYMRQVGVSFSDNFIAGVLLDQIEITKLLTEYFTARFDPDRDPAARGEAAVHDELIASLDDVASLDADRILRTYINLISATLRTNFYQVDEGGMPKGHVAFKLEPTAIDILPKPRPKYEIWVYSPRVEGVHLRFGDVARGGLRWSDRREDFRTEILGLVKAQMVKNALIVPTGAKGGFYCKNLPDMSDREAWLAEGKECYKVFIRSLLDVTDNLVDGQVRPPERVVRHDGDDTYLVVAADKGTAAFSDIANEVAISYGYWLGDAFASGGSVGYDHKDMGITARGAWESVKRHFRELGRDIQVEDFTAGGVGDMSGDVFGNGMLRSRHTRLVAAFDHRHIFLDPNPDAESSFVERQRLYDLPRSSWDDYDRSLISEGGGVYPRTLKSIEVSSTAAARLGLPGPAKLAPEELLRAILRAPIDLIYNGGIGTYVKASSESNADVGDKSNDSIRVNGNELRASVVGEGGNLGVTQLGRIEAALGGVRINTDAIDNSAGVDCSDHEVNIKILLDTLVKNGTVSPDDRGELLLSMSDEVADLVLTHNYRQNMVLGDARAQTLSMSSVYVRLMNELESTGLLDREVEFLPAPGQVAERNESGHGFTSPELAVLLAYVKMDLSGDALASELPDEVWAQSQLRDYFPAPLVQRFGDELGTHALRREIITTMLVNEMVDRAGLTFAFRLVEETATDPAQAIRVFMVAQELFDLRSFIRRIEETDGTVGTDTQIEMVLEYRRLIDRVARWLVHHRPSRIDVSSEIDRFRPVVTELLSSVPDLVRGTERTVMAERAERLQGSGVPERLAWRTAALLDEYPLLDIAELCETSGEEPAEVAELYYAVSDEFDAAVMLGQIGSLDRDNRWKSLARGALRDDFYAALQSVVGSILEGTDAGQSATARVDAWKQANSEHLDRVMRTVDEVRDLDQGDLASLSVALRLLRTVVRSSQGTIAAEPTGVVPLITQ
ncbi:NAD-glutamate dehydrogenase [Spelaeicoccus albus]|uniref:Glutamate dehydrogenase n=1 Tax=Spelaeicoccus albus TaxID=1280376 RepID=A0A7Z0D327_9MICO|nr:NAD-glutamate dehydrogenase [Spelaeicoccus albus]NYI67974.1 glutamate dehydrogenase [Spelaeicoccus albus]